MCKIKMPYTKFIVGIVLVWFCFSSVYGASPLDGAKRVVLPNGLTLITLVVPDSRAVSINLFVKTGSVNENSAISGISHFCEHMFYRGTKSRKGIYVKRVIEGYGGKFNAETTRDYTRFFLDIPSQYAFDAFKIYCDALINADYPSDLVEKERKVILEEYRLTKENPAFDIQKVLYSNAFGKDSPYGRMVIGTEKTIKCISRDDLLIYKRKRYIPKNIVIVVVGNFNEEKFINYVKKYFGGIPSSNSSSSPEVHPLSKKVEIEKTKPLPLKNDLFAVAFPSPGIKDWKDVVTMDVLTFMLGKGNKSLLNRVLCKEKKVAKSVNVEFYTSKYPGLVIFLAEVSPYKLKAFKDSLFSLIEDIKRGNFPDDDFQRAKQMLKKAYLYGLTTNDGKAQTLGFYQCLGDMNMAITYINDIESVSKEDVERVCKKYFSSHYIGYILKPKRWEDE